MSVKRIAWLVPAIACGVMAFAQQHAGAQQAANAKIPDITGSWDRYRGAPRAAGAAQQPDPYAPPQAPTPPLKPAAMKEWQAKLQAAREADAKGEPLAAGVVRCLPEGMPAMMGGPFPIEILQSRGQVTIIEEAYTQVRRILLDRPQKAVDDVEPGFYGYSVGRWEGDTLAVDTIGIKESVRYQNMPHSKDMRIKERIRLVSPEILWDEITIDDPMTLEKPWTFVYALKRMPGYTLLEYVCEDNREYADDKGVQRIRIDVPGR
jgi:hypothetical protein